METTVTPATFALCAARPVESPSPTVLRRRRLSRVLLVAAVVWLLALIALASRLSESPPLSAAALVPPLALLTGGLTLRSLAREVVAPPGPVRALEVSSERLQLTSGGREVVSVPLDCPFGVTLFSSPDRRRLLAAVSAGPSTLLFGTGLSGPFGTRLSGAPHGAGAQAADARLASQLLPACVLFSGEEGALDATAPDGEPTMLGVASFVELVAALEAVSPGCVGRLLLTDQRGDEIRLESDVLFARRARFELHKPLEWRAPLFQECFGQMRTDKPGSSGYQYFFAVIHWIELYFTGKQTTKINDSVC